ncbi:MAG TPA: hypothetical protein VHE78_12170 [Gemmatimonadaceae bacterium]|nr:hypothetical protein [Gemmatimonadaceae bacterium]
MGSHPVVEHHVLAAAYFEHAAKHHRLAAAHHERGEHAQGAQDVEVAYGHTSSAAFHAGEAAKYYASEYAAAQAAQLAKMPQFKELTRGAAHQGDQPGEQHGGQVS